MDGERVQRVCVLSWRLRRLAGRSSSLAQLFTRIDQRDERRAYSTCIHSLSFIPRCTCATHNLHLFREFKMAAPLLIFQLSRIALVYSTLNYTPTPAADEIIMCSERICEKFAPSKLPLRRDVCLLIFQRTKLFVPSPRRRW
jgi:hypothetical protein